jgi:glycine/sarcosine/betaine reductase complex component C subunit beta
MTRRAAILEAAFVLDHVPDLVRYGSKPWREKARFATVTGSLRSFEQAVDYAPNQVFIGNRAPESLWAQERPWWGDGDGRSASASRIGPFGAILDQAEFYRLLQEVDLFELVHLGEQPDPDNGDLALYDGATVVGAFARAHDEDEALSARALLDNLACKASGVHALRVLIESRGVDPDAIGYVIGAGEEAVGDRYNRGGGAMAKAIAESCGLVNANGSDVKAFCTSPVHALIMAGSLVQAGTFDRVLVVAGGSLAKLGMKFKGTLDHGVPVIEDVLGGMAVLVGPAAPGEPVLRLDAVGQHRTGCDSSQQSLLTEVVGRPLDKLGRRIADIDVYSTELHNPEITEPAGGYDVPERNYKLLSALAVMRGELERGDMDTFCRAHGLPGFAPTQGHIASAVPWIPHALQRMRSGDLRSTMLLAKGSLFLGRMTQMWDAVSVILEV